MPKRTGRPWQRRRDRIIRRDGGICHLCHQPGADSADHLVPYALGGTDHDDNLAAVHHNTEPRCNRIRGDRTDIDAVRSEITQRLNATTSSTWEW